jgi:hypothetical protein
MGLIRDLKICIHDIPYITTFTIFYNSVVKKHNFVEGQTMQKDAMEENVVV